jgi:hypothetical protein
MAVTVMHPDYILHRIDWERTEDAAIGSPAIRKRILRYLPEPWWEKEPDRYRAFCQRAYYTNYTGRTEAVLQGMVFRKPAIIDIPDAMRDLLEDFDGNGESISQVAKQSLSQRLRKSRFVFLADYPAAKPDITLAEQRALGLRPIAATYKAEDLTNWRFQSIGGKKRLVLAVLREYENISNDEFGHDYQYRYRVLRLRDGVYTQQLLSEGGRELMAEYVPQQADGTAFDYIPLHGVRELYTAPLQPIAELNLAHYWNTARLEDQVDVIGSPNLHIDVGDTSIEEWAASNPGEFKLGGRIGTLTKGGRMDIVQAEERPLVRVVRQDKAEEMASIGAAIVQRGGANETAEAARIRAGTETSQLDDVVNDLSEDIEATLESMARFVGVDPDSVNYMLNTDFFDSGLGAQELQAIVQGQILYGRKAALHMIRQGRIELPEGQTDEDLLEDAASSMLDSDVM